MSSTQRKEDEATPPKVAEATSPVPRCRRCRKVVVNGEIETYFARTGLCFWCAYVDAQG